MNIQKLRRLKQSRQGNRLRLISTTKTAIAMVYQAVELVIKKHNDEYRQDQETVQSMQSRISEVCLSLDSEDHDQVKYLHEIEKAFEKFRRTCAVCEDVRAQTIDTATEMIEMVNKYMLPTLPATLQETYRIDIDSMLDTTGEALAVADSFLKKLQMQR